MVIVGELSVSEGREEREMGDVGLGFVLWDLNVLEEIKLHRQSKEITSLKRDLGWIMVEVGKLADILIIERTLNNKRVKLKVSGLEGVEEK